MTGFPRSCSDDFAAEQRIRLARYLMTGMLAEALRDEHIDRLRHVVMGIAAEVVDELIASRGAQPTVDLRKPRRKLRLVRRGP